ncbi:MAG: hypothetical protein L6R39_001818 [Caloplaca ligustica]|nr:MAG: hypothetical protein L6R39_001818 [Caloplaca ligustica]
MSPTSRHALGDGEAPIASNANSEQEENQPPLSKNRLKKLRRDQAWEEGRERRKEIRKLKNKEKKLRKRAAAENNTPLEKIQEKRKASDETESHMAKQPKHHRNIQLPVSFVIDCGFDDLMLDGERKSLASQVTRSYSDNHKAPLRSHLIISSFGGHLKERFDTVLFGHHNNWKGVRFVEGDFQEAAKEARELMKSDQGGKLAGPFKGIDPAAQSENLGGSGEIVYLTSDSPDTLDELKPYSTYIIGGLVDKNRHKGICYKRAMDRGMKTAKLPIGDYMKMTSRFVLATNHVVEIMLRWLEVGDWAKAFLQVIPKRKGGVLKDGATVLDGSPAAVIYDEEVDDEFSGRGRGEKGTSDTGAAEALDKDTTAEAIEGSVVSSPPTSTTIGFQETFKFGNWHQPDETAETSSVFALG